MGCFNHYFRHLTDLPELFLKRVYHALSIKLKIELKKGPLTLNNSMEKVKTTKCFNIKEKYFKK